MVQFTIPVVSVDKIGYYFQIFHSIIFTPEQFETQKRVLINLLTTLQESQDLIPGKPAPGSAVFNQNTYYLPSKSDPSALMAH